MNDSTLRMEKFLASFEEVWGAKPDAQSTKDNQIRSYLPSRTERLTVFGARRPVSDGEQKPGYWSCDHTASSLYEQSSSKTDI
jgi:hypothetical protein